MLIREEKRKQWKQLSVENVKRNQIDNITYKSNHKTVAKVTQKGKVTGVSAGKAVITCTVVLKNSKTYSLKCNVTVEKQSLYKKKPVVYMTEDISPSGLDAVYKALKASPKRKGCSEIKHGGNW